MKVIRRELLLCLAISALVFTSALAWGTPFTTYGSASQATAVSSNAQQQTPDEQQQPGQMQQQKASSTFTGTIQKDGESYVLHTTSGKAYKLAGANNAESFVGKNVTVTGELNEEAETIQVSDIQEA